MLNGAIVIKNYGGIFLLETSCSIAILPVIVKHLMHLLLDFFFYISFILTEIKLLNFFRSDNLSDIYVMV